jgi:glycosyltransferase involved in cell wall biosynthesis
LCFFLRRRKRPWVLTPHGAYSPGFMAKKTFLRRAYYALAEHWLISGALTIQANHHSEIGIEDPILKEKLVFILNGQNLEEINYPVSNISADRPVFGFCGRLDEHVKGLDTLIKAFANFRMQSGRGTLWLIGDGPDRQKIKSRLSELGVSEYSQMFGALFGEKKVQYISNMDVFVQVSRHEAMPLGLIEAAALSRPLIISTATNLGEQVRAYGAGNVIDSNDPDELAETMNIFLSLWDKGELERIGKRSSEMVAKEFVWERTVEDLSRLVYSRVPE